MDRASRYEMVYKLREEGMSQQKIGRLLSISQSRVSQILKRPPLSLPQWGGYKPSKLTHQQQQDLVGYLEQGAEAFGFEGEVWSGKRVKVLIKEKFGVDYHHDSIPDILHKLGYSFQNPKVRDGRRDAEQVKLFKEERLPELKKKRWKKTGRSYI